MKIIQGRTPSGQTWAVRYERLPQATTREAESWFVQGILYEPKGIVRTEWQGYAASQADAEQTAADLARRYEQGRV